MIYKLLISRFTDKLAYCSAVIAVFWDFAVRMHPVRLPDFMTGVSPLWGVAVAAFFGGLLICKYICLEGYAISVKEMAAEKVELVVSVAKRDATIAALNGSLDDLKTSNQTLQNRLDSLKEKESASHLSGLRKKIRELEDDNKTALSIVSRNLKERLNEITSSDEQITFAVTILRQELDLVENEIKRGETTCYELSLKISNISENLFDLQAVILSSVKDANNQKSDDAAFNFLRMDAAADPSCLDLTYKFFKVAFHPDRFSSETLKSEAHRYFQQTVQAYNSFKRKSRASA